MQRFSFRITDNILVPFYQNLLCANLSAGYVVCCQIILLLLERWVTVFRPRPAFQAMRFPRNSLISSPSSHPRQREKSKRKERHQPDPAPSVFLPARPRPAPGLHLTSSSPTVAASGTRLLHPPVVDFCNLLMTYWRGR